MKFPILPDEFLFGYVGRLILSLGYQPAHARFADAVHIRLGSGDVCSTRSAVDILVEWSGVDIATITHQHTLAPAHLAFVPIEGATYLSASDVRYARRALGPQSAMPQFCLQCVKEDLNFWKFSYWRRTHQLPGITHCYKHRCRLSVEKTALAVQYQPHHFLGNHSRSTTRHQPPVIEQRMQTIWEGLIDYGKPIHVNKAIVLLNMRRASLRNKSSFSQYLLEAAYSMKSSSWCEENLSQEWFQNIFRRNAKATSIDFVFALALTFDDPDLAVSFLISETTSLTPQRVNQKPQKTQTPHSSAIEAFLSGLSLSEIFAMQNATQRSAFERQLRSLVKPAKFA